MDVFNWWRRRREKAGATTVTLDANSDADMIAALVPEISGMSEVEGMNYTMLAIAEWNQTCAESEAMEFAARLAESKQSFTDQGQTMPYWGNLWVLRTLQAELGGELPQEPTTIGGNELHAGL